MVSRNDQDEELQIIKENLFNCAMKSQWDEVVSIYRQQRRAHTAKMALSGETALHIAVSAGKEDVVELLIHEIVEPKVDVLCIGNQQGNTPLHLAASIGNAHMCRFISAIDPKLAEARNRERETPLFLAVLHGHMDSFLSLCEKIPGNELYACCRRGDGKTILHSAVAGEYFELALVIIHRLENLVDSVDEKGFSPLHILAGKPTAFRSGTHLNFIQKLIYQFIYVEKPKRVEDHPNIQQNSEEKMRVRRYPENYHTLMNFWNMIKRSVSVSHMIKAEGPAEDLEAENQGQPGFRGQRRSFPQNYAVCLELIKFTNKAMLVVLGLGFGMIREIVDKKEKHSWSLQIMGELLRRTPKYGYNRNGRNPKLSQSCEDEETTLEKNELLVSEGSFSGNCPLVDKNGSKNTSLSKCSSENTNMSKWSLQIMGELLRRTPKYGYNRNGRNPKLSHSCEDEETNELIVSEGSFSGNCPLVDKNGSKDTSLSKCSSENTNMREKITKILEFGNRETPILIAAKNGVKEMVDGILEKYPEAILDRNSKKKNVVLLAVENRQPEVYELLLGKNILKDTVFSAVDDAGNSALHLAAMMRDSQPWHIPGAALQMQWEIKWYKFVKDSMPRHFFVHRNKCNQTPEEIFTYHHADLVCRGGKWLNNTSSSCSVIATLIATVAFATSATVPGSFNDDSGRPNLEHRPAFNLFAISSLVALSFSVTAMVMFLAILSSRHEEDDFHKDLPEKLLLGLTTLFISISAILVSFCAGHFFVLRDELNRAAFPVYTITCLPISVFAMVEFPLYFDVVWTTFTKVPQRRYNVNL